MEHRAWVQENGTRFENVQSLSCFGHSRFQLPVASLHLEPGEPGVQLLECSLRPREPRARSGPRPNRRFAYSHRLRVSLGPSFQPYRVYRRRGEKTNWNDPEWPCCFLIAASGVSFLCFISSRVLSTYSVVLFPPQHPQPAVVSLRLPNKVSPSLFLFSVVAVVVAVVAVVDVVVVRCRFCYPRCHCFC